MKTLIISLLCATLLAGCAAMKSAAPADQQETAKESTVVVVRPDRYTLLGTQSVRDYVEVMYEEFATNQAGYPIVRIGLRNKGGEHWWDLKGPDFTLYAQAVFYSEPVIGTNVRSAPLYRTNKQPIPMQRGETADISFTAPVKGAQGYQVVLSED